METKELHKRLDKLTSVIVRMLGDRCVTCGRRLPFNRRQAGHYIPRAIKAVRWDLKNVNVQCNKCNVELGGNIKQYEKYMRNHYGSSVKRRYDDVYKLYKMGRLKAPSQTQLEDIYNDYLAAVRSLEGKAGELVDAKWKSIKK